MPRDNHYGPRFDDIKKAFPNATRYHWHEDAPWVGTDRHWMVATPSQCTDGVHTCNIWRIVELDELDGILQMGN